MSEYERLKKSETIAGKILHIDGDMRYSKKATAYYKKIGLMNAVVKNVSEKKQQYVIGDLIIKYQPDMLVITGHDKMLEQNRRFYDINNYKNSLNFVKTVENARKIIPSMEDLVIFAGACQSYFEELIECGANFASSPARVLIDFMDPIVVATKIVTTPENRFVTLNEILPEVREGSKGVGGTRGKGKLKILQ